MSRLQLNKEKPPEIQEENIRVETFTMVALFVYLFPAERESAPRVLFLFGFAYGRAFTFLGSSYGCSGRRRK